MKLQHALGGLEGLEPIPLETRVFVEPWEIRIFGINTAMIALSPRLNLPATSSTLKTVWTWADLRKGAESLNPLDYFKWRYYEKWLRGISGYFIANGTITADELEARTRAYLVQPTDPLPKRGAADIDDRVQRFLIEGESPQGERPAEPLFAVGDSVVVADPPSVEHTRCPGFLRNKPGVVETVYDHAYSYDCSTGADGIGPVMPVYCIRFDPQDIWPGNTESGFAYYADLFQAYVKPAPAA